MTVEDKYSTGMVINNSLSATITNININGSVNNNFNHAENCSVNSSMSSSSSCCSIMQHQSNLHKLGSDSKTLPRYNLDDKNSQPDSEKDDSNTIFIRVSISEQNIQKVLKFSLNDLVGNAKQRVLSTLNKEIKDGLNYGLYQPPFQGRAGKFLDDCRQLKEYSLSGPVANLEFKYKKRVYKFIKINQKELKALNVKSNFKRFLDLVRTNQISKANRLLDKGLDPNFHSDLGETPLTIAASLAEPKTMIMALYNGGAHLDFRSRDTLTPMHKAATIGNDKALKTLLELGAFAEVRDGRMLTPLYYSIMNASSVQLIEYLLFNGSTIGVRDDNNWHEIHHACKLGLSQHLDHLIYYGSDVNAKNNSGNTPLHVCAIHNQENCARILLFRGCDRQERNLANQTAFESAIIASNQVVADLIKNHRDSEIVPIRDRPFYNTKRRSIYADSQSNYSLNFNGSINSNVSSCHYSTMAHGNKKATLTSLATTHTLIDWNNSQDSSTTNSIRETNNGMSIATNLRSQSMPKLIDEDKNQQNDLPPPPPPAIHNILMNSEGSTSSTSRSRSISSDDHGFGSASLSQMSGSPNVEFSSSRKRLYSSIPNQTFICIRAFKPAQPGEIQLKKGDLIEVFSIGDSGYWEGRCVSTGCEGWFKASHVEEIILPENDTVDSIALKRKTFVDLLQNIDLSALRTVVLQRGKKGFGFVLRGAKTNDVKFEPTPEIPALQFLESVDKESNADKAGLKPLDFVLEINNCDVTSRTHAECVKLIKKTGDTLVLKVYTANNRNALNFMQSTSSNLASSNLASIYQTPGSLINKSIANLSASQSNISTSYYATSNIHQSQTVDEINTRILNPMDGTKSLPHKKKPIPPTRSPCTSLTTSPINESEPNSPKSPSSNEPIKPKGLLSYNEASLRIRNKIPERNSQNRASFHNDNFYINIVLAQIDELDKTIAQYDENDQSGRDNNGNDILALSSKKKLMANDANAASIRTRVPVRKPGLNKGDIFKQPVMGLNQKTHSVPNLFQETNLPQQHSNHMVPLPPPPTPPPPPPTIIPSIQNPNIYAAPNANFKTSNHNDALLTHLKRQGVHNSASSDTLVQEECSDENKFDECEIDYDMTLEANNNYIEPAVDYDQPKMSTFNQNKPPTSNSNLIMMLNRPGNNTPSPLTPRQLKQRNTAKRNSISCRSSSSTPTLNDSFTSNSSFTQQQLSDLQFLQSQKFDSDFIQTTQDLFSRYPYAKISISVTVSSYQSNMNTQNQVHTTQTTRQIEIDKQMFDRITSIQNQNPQTKIQPQTPIRTSSSLTPTTNPSTPTYNSFSSLSSSSPSSSSASSSASSSYSTSVYDSAINIETKQEDLNDAIKRVANEHLMKRQQLLGNNNKEEKPQQQHQQVSFSYKAAAALKLNNHATPVIQNGKSELECAIENRLKRQSLQKTEESTSNSQTSHTLPPPPPPPTLTNNIATSLPPPPSPQALSRLNSTKPAVNARPGVPPPPPPIAPLLNGTALSYKKQTVKQIVDETNNSSNVNNSSCNSNSNSSQVTKANSDPRCSSDFGALIAKKAAEKRAKFQETKPSVSSITFQAGVSKTMTSQQNQNIVQIQINEQKHTKSIPRNTHNVTNNLVKKTAATFQVTKNNVDTPIEKPLFINSGVKAKVSKFSNENAINSQPESIETESPNTNKPLNILTNSSLEMNKNESFINTAAKLLEKVKQQHSYKIGEVKLDKPKNPVVPKQSHDENLSKEASCNSECSVNL